MLPSGPVRALRRDSASSKQGEKPQYLGFVGHELGEQPCEANRLEAQVFPREVIAAARDVTLVVDQVDHREHGTEAVRQLGVVRDAVWNVGGTDLVLCPDETLRHRRLWHQKRTRDLGGPQTSEQPQRQRDLRAGRQSRVAAGEDQPQPVVAHGTDLGLVVRGARVEQRGLDVAVVARRLAPEAVDRAVAGRGHDPAARIRRDAGRGPAPRGDDECVLDRLFGDVDVAEEANQGRDDTAVLLAEDMLDRGAFRSGHEC